jgi:cytochrome c6
MSHRRIDVALYDTDDPVVRTHGNPTLKRRNQMRKSLVLALTLVVLSLALPAMADAGPDGAALYKGKCAMCHGADGKGQTSMGKSMKLRDLGSPEVQKQTDAELIAITANGKGKMPAYKSKMSEADIKAVIVAIRDMAKK